MAQTNLEERFLFIANNERQLHPILAGLLAPSYILSWDHGLAMEDICSLSEDLGVSLRITGGLAGPLGLMRPVQWFKVSLRQWLENSRQYYRHKRLPEGWFNVGDDLLELDIWEYPGAPEHWGGPIMSLQFWWSAESAQLISVEWRSGERYLEVAVAGSGEVTGLLELQGKWNDGQGFWVVEMAQPGAGRFPPETLIAEMLVAQLMAQQSGGALSVEVDKGQILMVLCIPRADVVSTEELDAVRLPGDIAEEVLLYAMALQITGWVVMGRGLLNLVSERVRALENHPEGKVREQVEKLREGCEKLASVLPNLEEEARRWREAAEPAIRAARVVPSAGRIRLPAGWPGLS